MRTHDERIRFLRPLRLEQLVDVHRQTVSSSTAEFTSSERYADSPVDNVLKVSTAILYSTRNETGSQWSSSIIGVIWSNLDALHTTLAIYISCINSA